MEKYISYLTGKSDTATALERAYSGWFKWQLEKMLMFLFMLKQQL
jgi:hypothetical protein